jgi:hypothetical protein
MNCLNDTEKSPCSTAGLTCNFRFIAIIIVAMHRFITIIIIAMLHHHTFHRHCTYQTSSADRWPNST